jgi:hypothetical protein
MNVSIDDPAKDDNTIKHTFMKELCRRDDEANRTRDTNVNINSNEFRIRAIQQDVLDAYRLERVIDFLQRFEMGTDDPFIELGGQDRTELVHLTNTGRAHCGEFGL